MCYVLYKQWIHVPYYKQIKPIKNLRFRFSSAIEIYEILFKDLTLISLILLMIIITIIIIRIISFCRFYFISHIILSWPFNVIFNTIFLLSKNIHRPRWHLFFVFIFICSCSIIGNYISFWKEVKLYPKRLFLCI